MRLRNLVVMLAVTALGLAACTGTADEPASPASDAPPTAEAGPVEQPSTTSIPQPEPPAPTERETAVPATDTPATGSEPTGEANADVEHVRVVQGSDGTWTFHVTVAHPDTGWEDYADGWDVVAPDGTVLKPDPDSPFTRLLLHPHENEQPFTRSQSGIEVPDGVTEVTVRAHDLVDGWGGREVTVDLTASSGERFEVERDG